MRKLDFAALLSSLPRNDSPLQALPSAPKAFDSNPSVLEDYVRPAFLAEDWPLGSTAILVEAPGAVGKTSAAEAIASALCWPLVSAQSAQVGSYSLSGLVQDSLGLQSDYLAQVASGRAGLVVDSLDEALFKAGTENFLAFIENVVRISGAGGPGPDNEGVRPPSIVLFSRSDAAELVRLVFEELNAPLACVQLDFFSQSQAEAFISSHLKQRYEATNRPEYNVFRASPKPFGALRDLRLKQVATLLSRDPDVKLADAWSDFNDFLGYAPVLVAIAESLAVSNPSAKRSTTLDADSQIDLVRKIVESILQREQRKFREGVAKKFKALSAATSTPAAEASLYAPHEQCARLLSRIESIPLTQTSPVDLPIEVRPQYEEAAAQFVLDHPFLRASRFASVVFSDYVRAQAVTDIRILAELQSEPVLDAEVVGPFFARFLLEAFGRNRVPEIREDHVESVVHSWSLEQDLASKDSPVIPYTTISFTEDGGTVVCDPDLMDRLEDAQLRFDVSDPSGAFQVGSRLRNAMLFSESGLIVGHRGGHVELGPRVFLVATEVQVEAESLRVSPHAGADESSTIFGGSLTANYLKRVDAATSDFRVSSMRQLPPLLRPFASNFFQESLADHFLVTYAHFVDLRNILMAFRPSLKGTRVHHEYYENRVLRASRFRNALSADLEARGVIRREREWIYLETVRLSAMEFSLVDVKAGEPSPAISRYLGTVGRPPSSGV